VLSLVLGGDMEQSFRQALTISSGDLGIFVGSPTAAIMMALTVASILLSVLIPKLGRLRQAVASNEGT
jgi:putative tricarboxylic transport membrane protein